MTYSFVIPLYNEAESLEELFGKILPAAKALGETFEIIFVDDGSNDSSLKTLLTIKKKNDFVKIVGLRGNNGKSAALQEGFSLAKGDFIITMDADMQDEPSEIPKLINKLNSGYDMVIGWKKDRKDPLAKTIPSKIFNIIVAAFSGLKLHDLNSGLKLFRREISDNIVLYGEMHRFIPVMAYNLGFSIAEVSVSHHERKYGKSKYGVSRLWKGLFDFITVMFLTKYGKRPLHLFGLIGLLLTLLGLIFGFYLTILRLNGITIGRRPLLTFTVLLIVSGLQFIFTGLLAEMILHLSPPKKTAVKEIY